MLRKSLLLAGLLYVLPVHADTFDSILAVITTGIEPAKTLIPNATGLDAKADQVPHAVIQAPSAAPKRAAYNSIDSGAVASATALHLSSAAALVVDQEKGQLLYAKNTHAIQPIASITKLMTAMVVLDARLQLDQQIRIAAEDVDTLKGTRSRLKVGTILTRRELLKLALMASENRAATALGRVYPGGMGAFIEAMNRKATSLGMRETRFLDSSGLNPGNVSTANDLAIMVNASYQYPLIRHFTTSESYEVEMETRKRRARLVEFHNSNSLVRAGSWDIGLSKTGYISEAGRCLVMQATIAARPVIIVLLDSWGKMTRVGDANRIKRWLESIPTGGFTNRMG